MEKELVEKLQEMMQYEFDSEWGQQGYNDGEFFGLGAKIAIDSKNNIYIADSGSTMSGRIQKFDSKGDFITKLLGEREEGQYWYNTIDDTYIDTSGNLYVVPGRSSNLVSIFDTNLEVVDEWDGIDFPHDEYFVYDEPTTYGHDLFIAKDKDGNIYYFNACQIFKFDSEFNFIKTWGG